MFGLFKSKQEAPGMIGDKARVTALLQELRTQATVLALRVAGSEVWHNSALVAIEPRHGLLALERIQDDAGHQRIIRVRRFHAMARYNGIVAFNAELSPDTKAEQTRYIVPMPRSIEHQERKAGGVTLAVGAAAVTILGNGSAMRGYLSDLSLSGLEIRTRDTVPLRPDEEASACNFQLPGGGAVSCRLKIISIQLDTTAHETRVRGEWLDLPEHQRRDIDRTIARLVQEQQQQQDAGRAKR